MIFWRWTILAVICASAVSLLAWRRNMQSHGQGRVSICFEGCGDSCAMFSITNNDNCEVSFGTWNLIDSETWGCWGVQVPCRITADHLKPGESCVLVAKVGHPSPDWWLLTTLERHTLKASIARHLGELRWGGLSLRLMEPPTLLKSGPIEQTNKPNPSIQRNGTSVWDHQVFPQASGGGPGR
jgi:hypothetical protein